MFNAYVWANYLEAGGKKYRSPVFPESVRPFCGRVFPTVRALRCAYCPDTQIVDEGIQQLHDLAHDLKEGNFGRWKRVHSIDMVMDSLYAEIDAGDGLSEKDIFFLLLRITRLLYGHTCLLLFLTFLFPITSNTISIYSKRSHTHLVSICRKCRSKSITESDFFTMAKFAVLFRISEKSITSLLANSAPFSTILLQSISEG